MNDDVIVIHKPRWVRDLVESINLHLDYIDPLIDDVDRAMFIESLLSVKLRTPNAYYNCYDYIYKTQAFNTKSSYNHFEKFDDMVADIFLSDECGCITDPIVPLVVDKDFRMKVDLYMGVITLWIERLS